MLQITHRGEKDEIHLNKPKTQTSSFPCFYRKTMEERFSIPNTVRSFALTLWMKSVRRCKEKKENIKGTSLSCSQVLLCGVAWIRHPVGKQVLPDPEKAQETPEVAGGHVEGAIDLLPYIWVSRHFSCIELLGDRQCISPQCLGNPPWDVRLRKSLGS